jgi:hypothetical protein
MPEETPTAFSLADLKVGDLIKLTGDGSEDLTGQVTGEGPAPGCNFWGFVHGLDGDPDQSNLTVQLLGTIRFLHTAPSLVNPLLPGQLLPASEGFFSFIQLKERNEYSLVCFPVAACEIQRARKVIFSFREEKT